MATQSTMVPRRSMSSVPTLTVKVGRDKSLRRRHPWVFSGAVQQVGGAPAPGDTVRVVAVDGSFLAWAAYSPVSQIVARVWSFDEADTIDAAFIAARVHASAARRSGLAARTDACRLVLIADRYGPAVVVEVTTTGADRWRAEIAAALLELPGVEGVYERSDIDIRKREGLDERVGLIAGTEPSDIIEIHEDGARYLVDVRSGHKTGLYLDQRESRMAVARFAAGRRVLNTFCYTGAFSVVAARAGATDVVGIDSSGPALAMAERNLRLNDCPPGELVEADVFADLRRLRARGERFGMIILDPPKLVTHAGTIDKATRAYKDINLIACQLLEPGGLLVTFSCSGLLEESLFQKVVAGAALDAKRDVRIVGRLHQASDHPVLLSVPETAYLKGLVCEVGP
jgi:23S rRNA (cytosine1962-C5)-methyltransferase